jgi:proline racemase
MIRRIKTIDAHAAGEPLRLIVSGFTSPSGVTMLDKATWVRTRRDRIRRALMHEPRGHAGMYGAVLTEPVEATSEAGVLFMHNAGYSTMCGHGVIAMVTIALERGLLQRRAGTEDIVLDTPAGTIRATATLAPDRPPDAPRVERVSFVNVPSFVLAGGLVVRVGARAFPVDVAFGGAFYAIVDSEATGIPLRGESLPALRQFAAHIKESVERAVTVVHPGEAGLHGIYGVVFTGPPDDPAAALRNVTIFADGQVDRSPCGTGTAAVMAVVDAMGLLTTEGLFLHESLIGTRFTGAIESRTVVGDHQAIIPRIEGSAWITGEHEFIIDDADPLANGFLL